MRKKILIMTILLLLCFITGALLGNPKEKKLYYEEKNVDCSAAIFKTKDIFEDNYNLFLSDLDVAPQILLKYCENIYFTTENLTDKFHMPLKTKIMAISDGKDIYVSTEYYSEETIVHELCHVYDYSNGWISSSDTFVPLYEKYKNEISVSAGNVEDEKEFFATCGERYFTGKELPEEITAFFDNIQ